MKHRGSVEAVESVVAPTGTYSTSLTISGAPVATGTGVIDHGALTGLSDDDHPRYSLADGSRAFSGPVGGVDPVAPSALTTKSYVDGEIVSVSGHLQGEIDGVPIPTLQDVYDASSSPLQVNNPIKPLWVQTTDPGYLGLWLEGRAWIDSGAGEVDIDGATLQVDSAVTSISSENVLISGSQGPGSTLGLYTSQMTVSGTEGLQVHADTTVSGGVQLGGVTPNHDDTYDVGSPEKHFRTIYLGNNQGEGLVFEAANSRWFLSKSPPATDYTFSLGGGDDLGPWGAGHFNNTFTFLMQDMNVGSAGNNELLFDVGAAGIFGSNPNAIYFRSNMGVLGDMKLGITFHSIFGGLQQPNVGFQLTNTGGTTWAYNLVFDNSTLPGDFTHSGLSQKKIKFQFDALDAMWIDSANISNGLVNIQGINHANWTISSDTWALFRISNSYPVKLQDNNSRLSTAYFTEPNINLNGYTLTNAATVYIGSAPTEATYNAGLWLTTNALFGSNTGQATGVNVVGTTNFLGGADLLGFNSTSANQPLTLYAYPNGTAESVTWSLYSDASIVNSAVFNWTLSGASAKLTVGLGGAGTPITTLQIGEDATAASLEKINFSFSNTTSVAVSGTGLGIEDRLTVGNEVVAASGTYSHSLTVSGVPVALGNADNPLDQLQGALIAQVFGA